MTHIAQNETRRLERLIEGLAGGDDIDVTVHTTRKGIKRLRAYLRLARKAVGTTTYRVENAALRDTARLLAPARDAFVLIETARALGAAPGMLAVLEERHRDAINRLESGGQIQARRRLEAIADRWRSHMASEPDASSIGAGLERTYRRALVDFERVHAAPTDEAFHGWRRRTKYLRYQLEALDAQKKLVRGFLELGDDLGLEHDHTVLIGVCDECKDRSGFDEVMLRAGERRAELRAQAIERGASLFEAEPATFRHMVSRALMLE